MLLHDLTRISDVEWELPQTGEMRVPGVLFADEALLADMDAKVFEQVGNVATLPGIVRASLAMPDAHSGYGFPIGGVAAFDPDRGGVVSAGGVGFDIACGVRTLTTGLAVEEVLRRQKDLADALFRHIPAGLGAGGSLRLRGREMDDMLLHGARWAVEAGFGEESDLERIEESGCMRGADPDGVSDQAKKRQERETGTLGSGNHYLEVQKIVRVFDPLAGQAFGLRENEALVSIHCGSRGLGHQIGTDYLRRMLKEAPGHGLRLPDRELACAPIRSELGGQYLGAMRAGINCALANRQVLTHLCREAMAALFPRTRLRVLYDVSHNTCKEEEHETAGRKRLLYVHRKGATRSLGPGHPDLPTAFRAIGQPVLIGGSMGSPSFILVGQPAAMQKTFGSANHGAGRNMSRSEAKRRFSGREVIAALERRGILVRAASLRDAAEEAPGAYKDVAAVVRTVEAAGLARRVAEVAPLVCVKG